MDRPITPHSQKLIDACGLGNVGLLDNLLKLPGSPDVINEEPERYENLMIRKEMLHAAIRENQVGMIYHLKKVYPDGFSDEFSAAAEAVKTPQLATLKAVVQVLPRMVHCHFSHFSCVLIELCRHGDIDCVEFVLNQGVGTEDNGFPGMYALYHTVDAERPLEFMEFILRYPGHIGTLEFRRAMEQGRVDVVELLSKPIYDCKRSRGSWDDGSRVLKDAQETGNQTMISLVRGIVKRLRRRRKRWWQFWIL